eukprot:IDg9864t1
MPKPRVVHTTHTALSPATELGTKPKVVFGYLDLSSSPLRACPYNSYLQDPCPASSFTCRTSQRRCPRLLLLRGLVITMQPSIIRASRLVPQVERRRGIVRVCDSALRACSL